MPNIANLKHHENPALEITPFDTAMYTLAKSVKDRKETRACLTQRGELHRRGLPATLEEYDKVEVLVGRQWRLRKVLGGI